MRLRRTPKRLTNNIMNGNANDARISWTNDHAGKFSWLILKLVIKNENFINENILHFVSKNPFVQLFKSKQMILR